MISFKYEIGLVKAFLDSHNCVAKYVESVPVIEGFEGETVWQGDVEVFDLKFHPSATRGYAWAYDNGAGGEIVTVLEQYPIDSPNVAVQTEIIAKMKAQRRSPTKSLGWR